ncbi:MAG: DegV family protein [Anaerolineales bacterium]
MSKVAIVTDSTAYIPKEYLEKYSISVVPQVLIWGEQTFEDGVDIQPDEFYRRLASAKVMPTSSQPRVSSMKETFSALLDRDYSVLGIFISAKLSGTLQSAMQAREMLPGGQEKIEIVDSYSASMGMGFQAFAAARAAADGAPLAECRALAENARSRAGVYFVVDTLEFLHRGGRIGGAQRLFGTALNLKPILALQDGKVDAIERIRTKRRAMERLVEIVVEQCAGKPAVRLAALDANAPYEARELLDSASGQLNVIEKIFASVSPVVGTHAGPGTIGLAYMIE